MTTPTTYLSALMLALAAVGSACAQGTPADHQAHHPMAGASAPAAAPAPMASMASMPSGMNHMGHMDHMHDMKAMHKKHQKEMKKYCTNKSSAKCQKVMDKHMKEMEKMHEHMGH
jgi:hypothetical protein